ncbi:MAG TPA: LysM peptidoglycan-binding domain-containing protein, partial [Verrucomicrobiae bacterium]|nr:LysM peptidoglycan-binding domain-containing protein [Verrucomicrobiae bacterium]
QKINIPAPAGSAPQGTAAAPTNPRGTGTGEHAYTVVSGDSLSKIATHFGTTVKALRSLNNLKTDRIVVGQKLKVPAKGAAPAETTPGAAPAQGTGQ